MPHISHEGPEVIDRCPDTVALHISSTLQAGLAFPYLLMGFDDPTERVRKLGAIISARAKKIETFDPALEIVLARNKLENVAQHLGDATEKIPGPLGSVLGSVHAVIDSFPTLPEKS